MKVGTAVLKNKLSQYLDKVRHGMPVVITDRRIPFAKIIPLGKAEKMSIDEHIALLIKEGVVSYQFAPYPIKSVKPISLLGITVSELISKERDER